jgi:hypothetical protein
MSTLDTILLIIFAGSLLFFIFWRAYRLARAIFHENVVGLLIFIGIVFVVWSWGYWIGLAYHHHILSDDFVITVYSPNWEFGEYKNCTTLNIAAIKKPRDLLCDGGEPSGRPEDGKMFNVRFYGRTYDDSSPALDPNTPKVVPTVFWWNCRKTESNPSIACEYAQEPK